MKRSFAAVSVLAGFAGLMWIGGYNFDERGPGVAWLALIAVYFAFLAYNLVED